MIHEFLRKHLDCVKKWAYSNAGLMELRIDELDCTKLLSDYEHEISLLAWAAVEPIGAEPNETIKNAIIQLRALDLLYMGEIWLFNNTESGLNLFQNRALCTITESVEEHFDGLRLAIVLRAVAQTPEACKRADGRVTAENRRLWLQQFVAQTDFLAKITLPSDADHPSELKPWLSDATQAPRLATIIDLCFLDRGAFFDLLFSEADHHAFDRLLAVNARNHPIYSLQARSLWFVNNIIELTTYGKKSGSHLTAPVIARCLAIHNAVSTQYTSTDAYTQLDSKYSQITATYTTKTWPDNYGWLLIRLIGLMRATTPAQCDKVLTYLKAANIEALKAWQECVDFLLTHPLCPMPRSIPLLLKQMYLCHETKNMTKAIEYAGVLILVLLKKYTERCDKFITSYPDKPGFTPLNHANKLKNTLASMGPLELRYIAACKAELKLIMQCPDWNAARICIETNINIDWGQQMAAEPELKRQTSTQRKTLAK